MKTQVIKRDGKLVDFNKKKISIAIQKAMQANLNDVKIDNNKADLVAEKIEKKVSEMDLVSIANIENLVHLYLIEVGLPFVAKSYEGYRAIREETRKRNTTDDSIYDLISWKNEEIMTENSNKNAKLASTQRDLIAGEVSKDLAKRKLLKPSTVQFHEEGVIHVHDLDYLAQSIVNCFHSKTEFVTSEGIKMFKDFYDGDKVEVVDKDGKWRNATVKKFGKQKMQTIVLQSGRTTKEIRATKDHRWLLKDGSVTTDLKVGDRLLLTPRIEEDVEYDGKMFVLGFILGDGTDYSNSISIRLCGDKQKYLDDFLNEGFKLSSTVYNDGTGDLLLRKKGEPLKQDFIESKAWRFLNKEQKINLFKGYYAADGNIKTPGRSRIATTSENLAQMIREIAPVAGFHIISEKEIIRDTNFKKQSLLFNFNLIKEQHYKKPWIVKEINRYDKRDYDAWCVVEPITKSFTLSSGVVTGNCCLVDLKDMLENGTIINGKMIETPKSFQVACTVTTQIIAQVASGQYGGQSINGVDRILAPYVRKSYDKHLCITLEEQKEYYGKTNIKIAEKIAWDRTKKEIKDGVQTMQYQINTLQTTNGLQ